MIKRRGAPRLTNHLSDCSVSSRVVVMVQWLAHLTCNPGNAGSIPTHGICVFHSKWISQYFVLARDYIVGFPVPHSKYKYNTHIYIWGGFISLTSIPDISTALMRPRRPKQYCLQLDIALWHYKAFAFMSKLSTLLG